MRHIVALGATAILFATVPSHAQVTPGTTEIREQTRLPRQNEGQSAGRRAPVNDALFAAAAADGGLSELALSQIGAQRATDPELKRFSEQMIQDHTRLNEELKAVAARKGFALPQTIDYRSQFCAQSLAGLSGAEFDRCYAKAQLVMHMEAVALFQAEAERGADRQVSAMASKGLSHIKEHLKMIKPIAKKYMNEDESEGARQDAGSRIERPSR